MLDALGRRAGKKVNGNLTQGFIYETAEACEARFKGEDPGFLYSRFSNPNISMFERRMIELEGAEAAGRR